MKRCKICSHSAVCDKAKHIENYRIRDCEHYSGWISVEERLPEESGDYLTYHGRFYMEIYFNADLCMWNVRFDDLENEIKSVTHWQPLPEPPKVGV